MCDLGYKNKKRRQNIYYGMIRNGSNSNDQVTEEAIDKR